VTDGEFPHSAGTLAALSPQERKKLSEIIERGHELEKAWSVSVSDESAISASAANLLLKLQTLIAQCATAESESLRRLAPFAKHLGPSMSPQHLAGILVAFERLSSRAVRDDEFLVSETDQAEAATERQQVIVLADNIRSAFNVGAILRTSECFAAEEVILCGYTSTPDQGQTARTSMGTEAYIPWRSEREMLTPLLELKTRGYTVIALETVSGAISVNEFAWPEKCALVLGNERFGIDRSILSEADHIVRIPLLGRKNSLNVGIALGIALANRMTSLSSRKKPGVTLPQPEDQLSPIGTFHCTAAHPADAPRQGVERKSGEVATIELQSGRGFEQAVADLEGFDRIWLLYRFHHNANWKPKVLPPRGPRIKRGVFATRAPYRPNPIGLSCVELVSVKGLSVAVRGHDLLDGTPIYDIKPYLPYADAFVSARTGWLQESSLQAFAISFSARAESELVWLEQKGLLQLRDFLLAQLQYEPLDQARKRVATLYAEKGLHQIAYRTWRADFTLDENEQRIEVTAIYSGYKVSELALNPDPKAAVENDRYRDHDLHRQFNASFIKTVPATS
jgi:tRNA-Thr(GGU) m(6)t(6)A37 methyltransferase TsaA